MFYVLFTGTTRPDQSALSEQYYSTLQPILHNIEGFIEEIPFGDPKQPGGELLFAKFIDENSIKRWKNNSTHLKIMHHARHHLFDSFRITIGTDTPEKSPATEGAARIVVAYQRPATQELSPEHMQLSHVTIGETSKLTTSSEFYVGENSWMWVSRLKTEASAEEFEASLDRVSGDAVYRIYTVREYTKTDRKEAPIGIDEAEAKTGALE